MISRLLRFAQSSIDSFGLSRESGLSDRDPLFERTPQAWSYAGPGEQNEIRSCMIELRGVARRLRLSVDQIRLAADLLEQGYQPGFIWRYRADETGGLSRESLWALKLEIDRQTRLHQAREKVKQQLPKGAELDEEAAKFLERATTEVEIEASLRCFRARRGLAQNQDRSGQAGQLLEKMIAYSGPAIADIQQWTAEQLSVDAPQAAQILEQTEKLLTVLIQCDTELNEKLRRTIQRKAQLHVEFVEAGSSDSNQTPGAAKKDHAESQPARDSAGSNADEATTSADTPSPTETSSKSDASPAADDSSTDSGSQATDVVENGSTEQVEQPESGAIPTEEIPTAEIAAEGANAEETPTSPTAESGAQPADSLDNPATVEATESALSSASNDGTQPDDAPATETKEPPPEIQSEASLDSPSSPKASGESKSKSDSTAATPKKSPGKMTPRQRRRRWLIAMLQPMKSLKRSVGKLTAYQQLMLGRGRRSQLVKTPLAYDCKPLFQMACSAFVEESHSLSGWFSTAVSNSLEKVLLPKLEADALSDLEELAQEKLLENAADQLRQNLMRRPVRGHNIMVVDTVGPKMSSVAIVGRDGSVLATDEVSCSAHPDTINQNVVRLGELAHRYKVTLVTLTNGPARRFLVLTVRELMKQSAAGRLRWTMTDRGGAEAYAAGRTALRELSAHNRRDRAAIWIGRCLQNPLGELLKGDINRLRLGSFQRELPQEPLKQLIRETIADCVFERGVDTHNASIDELMYVAGVENEQAQQIATLAEQQNLHSRSQLVEAVTNWPEKQARQAIPLLRVFGSEQTLDASAIHPEDYRLAQRLIDNTEFAAPPAAPEGWQMPAPPAEPMQADEKETLPGDSTEATLSADSSSGESAASSETSPSESPTSETEQDGKNQGEAAGESPSVADAPAAVDADGNPAITEAAPKEDTTAEATPDQPASETEVAAAEPSADANSSTPNTPTDTADESNPTDSAQSPEAPADSADENAYPSDIEYSEDVQTNAQPGPSIDVEKLAREWQVGRAKLRWIAECLHDPFQDPRLQGTPIPMLSEMPTLATLERGMCLWAVVVGVADFGAFVEISPDCSGLVHISRLSADYVEDPHQVVQIGDLILTWVVSVDEKKNRVALTALSPAEVAAAKAEADKRGQQRRERQPHGSGQGNAGGGGRGGSQDRGARGHGGQRGGGQGGRGQGGRGQGGRGNQGDRSRSGGRSRGDGRGRGKAVVVTSKKPKAPISAAMKEGDEPLRSFSDLMQFYEAKRTDDVPAPKSSEKSPPPEADSLATSVPDPSEAKNEDSSPTPPTENDSAGSESTDQ